MTRPPLRQFPRLIGLSATLLLTACQLTPRSAEPPVLLNSLGMTLIPVPGTGLHACRHETRVRDYRAFATATHREWLQTEFRQSANHPATMVSWHDAVAFCEWLSRKEGRHYRLPTDAEWTLLLLQNQQVTQPALYPWGSATLPPPHGNYCDRQFGRQFGKDYAARWLENYDDGHAATAPIGACTPHSLPFLDLSGNVWEWCTTWIDPSHPRERVVRGGSWRTADVSRLQSTFRGPDPPDFRIDSVGFRIFLVTSNNPTPQNPL